MGIVLLFLSLTIVAMIIKVIVWIRDYKYDKKLAQKEYEKSQHSMYWCAQKEPRKAKASFWDASDLQIVFTIFFGLFLGTLTALCLGLGLCHIDDRDEYNQLVYQKQVLEYRLEQGELEGNELLWKDITDFNNNIRSKKYWRNNPWTNWFNNPLINKVDYIEIEGMAKSSNEQLWDKYGGK